MTRKSRKIIAYTAAVLSLPAFVNCFFISFLVYALIVVSGFWASPGAMLLKLLRLSLHSADAMLVAFVVVSGVLYWVLFSCLVVSFGRGRRLSRWMKTFCVLVVLAVTAEAIRLELFGDKLVLWFGSFSAPNAFALFALIVLDERVPPEMSCGSIATKVSADVGIERGGNVGERNDLTAI